MSKIAYDLLKIKGIVFDVDGVLSPATIPVGDDGIPRRMANLKDGYSMVQALKHGLKIAIITGAVSPGVEERMTKIGVTDFYAGKMDKLPILKEWLQKVGLQPDEVAYVGDDVPDLAPMGYVGLPVTPADGCRDTKAIARYTTEAIGGHGVARELIEEIMRAQDIWPASAEAFG